MRKFIGLLAIVALGTVLWAETDYQVGQGVERVITRRLQVQGHNARAIIDGAVEITGDVNMIGAVDVVGVLSGANLSTTGKVTGSTFGGGSYTGGTFTASGRIASQSASSGEFRLGYLTTYGWLFSTIGGGQTLQFMADYATTGGVAKATLTDAGIFTVATLRGSLASTYVSGGLCATMPVTVTASTTTNASIVVQAKDPAGANLAKSVGFEFWFSTTAVQTLPSTNEVESFSIQNGDLRMYREASSAVPTYVAQTDTAGLFRLNGVSMIASITNQFHLLGPNGYYTNAVVVW